MMGVAPEVQQQALRLGDRRPRHPRTVPPEVDVEVDVDVDVDVAR
jgi:hypothetical protein